MPAYNLNLRVSFSHTVENVEASCLEEAIDIIRSDFDQDSDADYDFEVIDSEQVQSSTSYTSMASVLLQNSQVTSRPTSYTPMNSVQRPSSRVVSGYTPFSRN